jgi:hypothetical protein
MPGGWANKTKKCRRRASGRSTGSNFKKIFGVAVCAAKCKKTKPFHKKKLLAYHCPSCQQQKQSAETVVKSILSAQVHKSIVRIVAKQKLAPSKKYMAKPVQKRHPYPQAEKKCE